MENQYGIAVTNKFGLFLDNDEDTLEILQLQEEQLKSKKDDKTKKDVKNEKAAKSSKGKLNKKGNAPAPDLKPKGTDQNANKKDAEKPPRAKSRQDQGERPERPPRQQRESGGGFGERTDRPPRRDRDRRSEGEGRSGPPQSDGFGRRDRDERGERPESGRGRGRGRGGRGAPRGRGEGFNRFGKREFERHSGSDRTSGIKATDKREGGGAHNWGTMKDDLDTGKTEHFRDTTLNDSNVSAENEDWAAQTEGTENQDPNSAPAPVEGEEEKAEVEEEPKEMTLDEYKAMQEKNRLRNEFKVRRANEGADEAQWKKMHQLKKKPQEEEEDEDEEDDDEDEDARRPKNTVAIEITFNEPARRGGRGGRGGGRGGRGRGDEGRGGRGMGRGGFRSGERGGGRGGGRGGRGSREAAPNVEDEDAFPSLIKAAAS